LQFLRRVATKDKKPITIRHLNLPKCQRNRKDTNHEDKAVLGEDSVSAAQKAEEGANRYEISSRSIPQTENRQRNQTEKVNKQTN